MNPAVSISTCVCGFFPLLHTVIYVGLQILGAILGADCSTQKHIPLCQVDQSVYLSETMARPKRQRPVKLIHDGPQSSISPASLYHSIAAGMMHINRAVKDQEILSSWLYHFYFRSDSQEMGSSWPPCQCTFHAGSVANAWNAILEG